VLCVGTRLYIYISTTQHLGARRRAASSKGLFEKFKKEISQHNVNRIGESACVDRVAGTSYSENFKKTVEKKEYS
jgi:hypothetical protein